MRNKSFNRLFLNFALAIDDSNKTIKKIVLYVVGDTFFPFFDLYNFLFMIASISFDIFTLISLFSLCLYASLLLSHPLFEFFIFLATSLVAMLSDCIYSGGKQPRFFLVHLCMCACVSLANVFALVLAIYKRQ